MIGGWFSRRLALRGSDLGRWPGRERQAALRLLRRSAAARRRYLAALDDDGGGLDVEAASLDPALTARLLAGARRGIVDHAHRPGDRARARVPLPAMRWGALAACAALGVWVGWTASAGVPPPTLLASVQITPMTDSLP